MKTIFILYGASKEALHALADENEAELLVATVRMFDQLADANDGTHNSAAAIAIGRSGWVGLAKRS